MKLVNPTIRTPLVAFICIGVALLVISSLNENRSHQANTENNQVKENELLAPSANSVGQTEKTVAAAGAYLLGDGNLYAFRTEKRWPIASVTKLMTALAVKRLMSPGEVVSITEEEVAVTGTAGEFKAGERFTTEDLTKAMLMVSSNDAAAALADYYGKENLVQEMNQLAAEIGMTNTIFVDTTGLSLQNLSTVEDLNKLVKFIWDSQPEIFALTREPSITIVDLNTGIKRQLYNINLFAGRKNFLGGKTGQTPVSAGNLVSVFNVPHQSAPVVIIVLGAEGDRFQETEKILMKL